MFDLMIFGSFEEMKKKDSMCMCMNGISLTHTIQLLPVYAQCGMAVVVLPHKEETANG